LAKVVVDLTQKRSSKTKRFTIQPPPQISIFKCWSVALVSHKSWDIHKTSASPTPGNDPRHSNVRAWRPRNLHQTGPVILMQRALAALILSQLRIFVHRAETIKLAIQAKRSDNMTAKDHVAHCSPSTYRGERPPS